MADRSATSDTDGTCGSDEKSLTRAGPHRAADARAGDDSTAQSQSLRRHVRDKVTVSGALTIRNKSKASYEDSLGLPPNISFMPTAVCGDKNTNPAIGTGDKESGEGGESVVGVPIGTSLGWMEGTCIRWKGTFGFLSAYPTPAPLASARVSAPMPAIALAAPTPIPAPPTVASSSSLAPASSIVPADEIVQSAQEGLSSQNGLSVPAADRAVSLAKGAVGEKGERETGAMGFRSDKGLRVYVHYQSLNFSPPIMQLSRGQAVRVLVEMGDRGPLGRCIEALQ